MSQLLVAFANMAEAALSDPERFSAPRLTPAEVNRRRREIALLRALTPAEATALLRDRQLPERLPKIAVEVGLDLDSCVRVLCGAAYKLTEGLHFRLPESEGCS
jgi:hypothetical protein